MEGLMEGGPLPSVHAGGVPEEVPGEVVQWQTLCGVGSGQGSVVTA